MQSNDVIGGTCATTTLRRWQSQWDDKHNGIACESNRQLICWLTLTSTQASYDSSRDLSINCEIHSCCRLQNAMHSHKSVCRSWTQRHVLVCTKRLKSRLDDEESTIVLFCSRTMRYKYVVNRNMSVRTMWSENSPCIKPNIDERYGPSNIQIQHFQQSHISINYAPEPISRLLDKKSIANHAEHFAGFAFGCSGMHTCSLTHTRTDKCDAAHQHNQRTTTCTSGCYFLFMCISFVSILFTALNHTSNTRRGTHEQKTPTNHRVNWWTGWEAYQRTS